ncbi:MAG: SDR family NAD(P)-dependent oxidoreductase, partial [Rhizobiaceae bacterium]|nr:SDR family NAD(P)-dependent oxidoreductase [Rhizobiaceae bacterium]
PIVLAVFNAGTYFPTRGERLDASNVVKTFEINLFGVVYGMVPALDRMRSRGRGHIVVVGSASAYFGWPAAASYSASKAALNSLAEALKHDLDKLNIRIQVINPGFVDTPLTRKNDFAMPAMIGADDAAGRMAQGIRSGGFEISFPKRLNWPLKLLGILPFAWRYFIIHRITRWDSRPLAPARKPRD